MSEADADYINGLLAVKEPTLDPSARTVLEQLRGELEKKKLAQVDYTKAKAQLEDAARRFNDGAARADALASALLAMRPDRDPTPTDVPQPKPRKGKR